MRTAELLDIIKERGLYIVIVDGEVRLLGDRQAVTSSMLKVIRYHREAILEMYKHCWEWK